eukprot:3117981-Pleurochrysis_carterae.AAC.1
MAAEIAERKATKVSAAKKAAEATAEKAAKAAAKAVEQAAAKAGTTAAKAEAAAAAKAAKANAKEKAASTFGAKGTVRLQKHTRVHPLLLLAIMTDARFFSSDNKRVGKRGQPTTAATATAAKRASTACGRARTARGDQVSVDRNGKEASAKTETTPAPTTRGNEVAPARTPLQPLPVNVAAPQQQTPGLSTKMEVRRAALACYAR